MGALILIILGGFLIYFIFIKKSPSGTTLLNHKNEIHKYVQNNGGMVKLYEGIVNYFQRDGFEIREVKKDYLYMHYGTNEGKVGLEILQHELDGAVITIGTELPNGKSYSHKIEVKSYDNDKEVLEKLLAPLDDLKHNATKNLKETSDTKEIESTKNKKPQFRINHYVAMNPEQEQFKQWCREDEERRKKFKERKNIYEEIEKDEDLMSSEEKLEELAGSFYKKQEFEKAAHFFSKAYYLNTKKAKYLYKTIECTVKDKDYELAFDLLYLANKIHGKDYRQHLYRADIYKEQGKIDLANKELKAAEKMYK